MKRLLTLIVAVTAISGSAATFPTDDRAIVHVLGRTAFGPRPGDVERVRNHGHPALPRRTAASRADQRRRAERPSRRSDHDQFELAADCGSVRDSPARGAQAEKAGREGRRIRQLRRRQPAARRDAAARQQRDGGALRAEAAARDLQRAAASGSAHRLLVQPFQRRRAQGRRSLPAHRVRARHHSAARAGQVPRSAGGDRQEPGDAVLSRQLDERGSERPAPSGQRRSSSHRAWSIRRPRHDAADGARGAGEPGQESAERPERKLRPRADGAAHAGSRRRLHPEGRDRSRARAHRLEHRPAAGRRQLHLQPAPSRHRTESRARPRHQGGRRRIGRRAGARHPRSAPVDRAPSSPPSWRAASSATRRRRRWSSAPRSASATPTATCGRWCA